MVCQPISSTLHFYDLFFDISIKVAYFTKYLYNIITAGLFIFSKNIAFIIFINYYNS